MIRQIYTHSHIHTTNKHAQSNKRSFHCNTVKYTLNFTILLPSYYMHWLYFNFIYFVFFLFCLIVPFVVSFWCSFQRKWFQINSQILIAIATTKNVNRSVVETAVKMCVVIYSMCHGTANNCFITQFVICVLHWISFTSIVRFISCEKKKDTNVWDIVWTLEAIERDSHQTRPVSKSRKKNCFCFANLKKKSWFRCAP